MNLLHLPFPTYNKSAAHNHTYLIELIVTLLKWELIQTAPSDGKVCLFYWGFTPLSTLFQIYHGNSSLIHDPWVNKRTSTRLGNVPCPKAFHHDQCCDWGFQFYQGESSVCSSMMPGRITKTRLYRKHIQNKSVYMS